MKKKRSNVPPKTPQDKKLSAQHLKESIAFNQKHVSDHKKALSKGGSDKYNKDHIKHHEKAIKKDKKLLEKRTKKRATNLGNPPASAYPPNPFTLPLKAKDPTKSMNRLKRGMKGYRR